MGSAQPRSELKKCDHRKCSCCANAGEMLTRLLKWARYACAPTYERNALSSIPTMLCMRWPRWYIDAKWLNAIAYNLFVSPLLRKSFSLFLFFHYAWCSRQIWYEMHDTQAMTRQQQRITGGHLAIGLGALQYVHFASWFYLDIYCIMGCYYTLYHNTYAFSLSFYKVYM